MIGVTLAKYWIPVKKDSNRMIFYNYDLLLEKCWRYIRYKNEA